MAMTYITLLCSARAQKNGTPLQVNYATTLRCQRTPVICNPNSMPRKRTQRKFLSSLALFVFAVLPTIAAAADGVEGYWKTKDGAIVWVHPCGANECLRIVKLSPVVPERTDKKNPDKNQRTRPLCRLDIGTGFRRTDASRLTDGHLYDPESGWTYKGTVISKGDELTLRGFVGISIFGRTEVWHRTTAVAESDCK